MRRRDKQDGAILTVGNLRKKYPQVSFGPDTVDELSDPVYSDYRPADIAHHIVQEVGTELVDGKWQFVYDHFSLDTEEYRQDFFSQLLVELADTRYEYENGTTEVGGVTVRTSREYRSVMNSALQSFARRPEQTRRWKGADGVFRPITQPELEAIFNHVDDYVEQCFVREEDLKGQLEAVELDMSNPDALMQLDVIAAEFDQGWPI